MNARTSSSNGLNDSPAASSETALTETVPSDTASPAITSSGKKLPSCWFRLAHALLMSTAMVFAMTLIITAVNIGLVDDFSAAGCGLLVLLTFLRCR